MSLRTTLLRLVLMHWYKGRVPPGSVVWATEALEAVALPPDPDVVS